MSTAKLALAQLKGRGWRGAAGAPKGTIARPSAEVPKLFNQMRTAQTEIDAARRRIHLNEARKILHAGAVVLLTPSQLAANDREDKLDRGLITKLEADRAKLSAAIKKAMGV